MDNQNRDLGIAAGAICFSLLSLPWLGWAFGGMAVNDTNRYVWRDLAIVFAGESPLALISAFFGFSIARNSLRLVIVSSFPVAASIVWLVYLWFFHRGGLFS